MRKKILALSLGIFMAAIAVPFSNAYAHDFRQGMHEGRGLDKVFCKKAHFILENAEALGIPSDKLEAIKNLNLETKKVLIKQNADIEIVNLDLKTKLHDYPVNVELVNKLVDQKYELEKIQAKVVVDAIAKLKADLTKEQNDKMIKLWEDHEKAEAGEER